MLLVCLITTLVIENTLSGCTSVVQLSEAGGGDGGGQMLAWFVVLLAHSEAGFGLPGLGLSLSLCYPRLGYVGYARRCVVGLVLHFLIPSLSPSLLPPESTKPAASALQ